MGIVLGVPVYNNATDYTGDLDLIVEPCVLRCAPTAGHNPINDYIMLEVIGGSIGSKAQTLQRARSYNNGGSQGIFERVKGDSGAFSSWYRIDNYGCNTPSDLASLLGDRQQGEVASGTTVSINNGNRPGNVSILSAFGNDSEAFVGFIGTKSLKNSGEQVSPVSMLSILSNGITVEDAWYGRVSLTSSSGHTIKYVITDIKRGDF